jgi:hypothetical protein
MSGSVNELFGDLVSESVRKQLGLNSCCEKLVVEAEDSSGIHRKGNVRR